MTPEQAKGQAGSCPTVQIKSGDSYVVINACDYDKTVHELFGGEKKGPGKDGEKKGPGKDEK